MTPALGTELKTIRPAQYGGYAGERTLVRQCAAWQAIGLGNPWSGGFGW